MIDNEKRTENDSENMPEHFPVEPNYHPVHRIPRKVYDFLASSELALFLLVALLCCCITGVTVYRGDKAWQVIFGSLWFNGLLVMLVVNVACCFFGRIWGRKITAVTFGMILFHLSFVSIFLGVVFNSQTYLDASIRLTEGEVLQNSNLANYDEFRRGRFFNLAKLSGQTELIKVLPKYKVAGEEKRYAFDVAVSDHDQLVRDIIYTTKKLEYNGLRYFREKEGYSVLVVLHDKQGNELYGAHIPLQSLRQPDNTFLYTTGTKEKAGSLPFPQGDMNPLYNLQVTYHPDMEKDRSGRATLEFRPYSTVGKHREVTPGHVTRTVEIGEKLSSGEYFFSVKEIHYWVGMTVRYDPGYPLVLTSLWVGLLGMVITTAGRIMRGRRSGNAAVPTAQLEG